MLLSFLPLLLLLLLLRLLLLLLLLTPPRLSLPVSPLSQNPVHPALSTSTREVQSLDLCLFVDDLTVHVR